MKPGPGTGGKPVVGVTHVPAPLGEIEQLPEGTVASPSICVRGVSGSGKTTGITHLMEAGFNVLYTDVENKAQQVVRYRPLIVSISKPVENKATGVKSPPTVRQKYERLWEFVDKLGEGGYTEHNGKPIDLIAGDGITEVMEIIKDYQMANMPRAASTGSKDTHELYRRIGDEGIRFLGAVKDAAGTACLLAGMRPVGQYWTVVETFDLETRSYPLDLPGNLTGKKLPTKFEAVLHLGVRKDTDGRAVYVCSSVGEEGVFEAKAPGGVLAPEEFQWNMADIFKQLQEAYRQMAGKEDKDGDERR